MSEGDWAFTIGCSVAGILAASVLMALLPVKRPPFRVRLMPPPGGTGVVRPKPPVRHVVHHVAAAAPGRPPSTDFLIMAALMFRLHSYNVADPAWGIGDNDCAVADAIREEMDGPWGRMTDEERERARALSRRLNDFSREIFRDTRPPHRKGDA